MGARECFIKPIEYLRKIRFFEEYSDSYSEEIFERLRNFQGYFSRLV
ncbi:MAG: hypothetical protein JTT15_02650 [Candidatus Brockarchaeota archaeon]|nr:hypothetical protein [Candidatus Brockarchaeota archaeon]